MPECPVCTSGSLFYLGTLGNLAWFQCVNCGAEFHLDEITWFDRDGLLDIVDIAEGRLVETD